MKHGGRAVTVLLLSALFALSFASLNAFDFSTIKDKITEFELDNGLKFIIYEDHSAPVASFVTYADVGSADDPKGGTGLAHVFEHMAFKGTSEIGTDDPKNERKVLEKIDSLYYAMRNERLNGASADTARLTELHDEFAAAQEEAAKYTVVNEFSRIIETEGGVGLNAGTAYDQTVYFFSLPSNRSELWFALESGRFYDPVLREFYKERDVVEEERRMRTESNPIGKLVEEFLAAAYKAHPYGIPVVGHMSDLDALTRQTALNFFKTYYVPSNLVVGIAGDVNPKQMKKLAETYFGRIPKSPKPLPIQTVEPKQLGEKRVVVEDPAQPFYIAGWHRPSATDDDAPVFDAIADYLGQGRTSLLYKSLVKDKKMAVDVQAMAQFPGGKYPTLFGVYAVPAKGVTALECEKEILAEVERLKTEQIPAEELDKIKARAKADLVRRMQSRQGMAIQLAAYETMYGDWHELFTELDRINAVTAEDIQRVAKEYLTRENRTVGYIETVDKDEEI